jgi:hypothetical protein
MTTELMDAPAVKPREPRKPRGVKTSVPQAIPKDKVTIILSRETNLRLTVHAAALRVDRSALVESLLREHLKRFVLQDRGDRDTGEDRQPDAA